MLPFTRQIRAFQKGQFVGDMGPCHVNAAWLDRRGTETSLFKGNKIPAHMTWPMAQTFGG
jgi:hypothetical protein